MLCNFDQWWKKSLLSYNIMPINFYNMNSDKNSHVKKEKKHILEILIKKQQQKCKFYMESLIHVHKCYKQIVAYKNQ